MIPDECKMDAALKELSKLEKLTADGKAKSPSIDQTLDALLSALRAEQERIQSGNASPETFEGLATKVESLKKDLDDRQKEIYNSLSRYGKALDKVRPRHIPSMLVDKSQLHPHRNSQMLCQPSARCLLPPRLLRLWTVRLLCTFSEPVSSQPLKRSSRHVLLIAPVTPYLYSHLGSRRQCFGGDEGTFP